MTAAGPVAAAMSETELEVHVRGILKGTAALGPGLLLGYHTRDSRRSHAGFPDWTFAGPGGVLFRELKTARGKLTAAQQDWHRVLAAAGADVGVWRPADLLDGRVARELAAIARRPATVPRGAA